MLSLRKLLKKALLSSLTFSISAFALKGNGVCVFDIDYTLKCDGAYAAVEACKRQGFKLAINTSRNRDWAREVITDGTLLKKGFDAEFVTNAFYQFGLNGAFQYREPFKPHLPFEQIFQNKSYGMRQIAKYYGYKTDGTDSRKMVLFDDGFHNIRQMEPNDFDLFRYPYCMKDSDGLCYSEPGDAPLETPFPRNWRIYRAKWIGYMCLRWNDPQKAYQDAMEVTNQIMRESRYA